MATKADEHETRASTVGGAAHAQPTAAVVAAPRATPEEMAAATIGAQIILDYNGEGSLGARGGMGGTIEENTAARDAHLISVGLDPNAPSGPPTGVPWEPPVPLSATTRHQTASGQATRMSSLAAGALTGDREPPPPPETLAGAASRR
jgi:hypothetical protein